MKKSNIFGTNTTKENDLAEIKKNLLTIEGENTYN